MIIVTLSNAGELVSVQYEGENAVPAGTMPPADFDQGRLAGVTNVQVLRFEPADPEEEGGGLVCIFDPSTGRMICH